MELDAQVEDTLPASATNPEQKHKHKKKDKHKHKHHKRSKRERHGDAGHDLLAGQERPALAEGEVTCNGSEDGELPGPPAVEGLAHAPVSVAHDAQEAAAGSPAGLEHTKELEQELPSAKRR